MSSNIEELCKSINDLVERETQRKGNASVVNTRLLVFCTVEWIIGRTNILLTILPEKIEVEVHRRECSKRVSCKSFYMKEVETDDTLHKSIVFNNRSEEVIASYIVKQIRKYM